MEKFEKIVYKCDYCGQEHESEEWMVIHEECCAWNPKNQPCAQCSNMIIGMGCSKGMAMESIGGNVICFYYKKGIPINPFEHIMKLDGDPPLGGGNGDFF